jgi:transposase
MLALVQQLFLLQDHLADYDKEIARRFQANADQPIFSGLPRAGKQLAPRLVAEWGDDRTRYASAASVQALGGTSPVPFESGKHASVHQRRACVKPVRSALYQFAWQRTFQEPRAEAYYRRKRQEGKTQSKAVRAAPQCVGSDYLRPLAQARALPNGHLPRGPAGSWSSGRLKQPRASKRDGTGTQNGSVILLT